MSQTVKTLLTTEWSQKTRQMLLWQQYAYNIFSITNGSFNGITTGTTTWATLSQRWSFQWFSAANNANNACVFNFELPSDYVAGRNIKVEIHYSYVDASGWAIQRWLGIQRVEWVTPYTNDTGDVLRNEQTVTAPIQATYLPQSHSYTFAGTNFLPWDKIAIMVYRNTTTNNPDTLGATVYANIVSIYSV